MPWQELSVMQRREEFVRLASMKGAKIAVLCRQFGVSRATAYRLLSRYRREGQEGLKDRSRRPHKSPSRADEATEALVLRLREESNNAWGGRKISFVAERDFAVKVAPSTVTEILRRHSKLDRVNPQHPGPMQRFERSQPNELWQMDFKGHFALLSGRCHPLTVLDDHSRYAIGLKACGNETEQTVRTCLTEFFRFYGLPYSMLMDNGSPWGAPGEGPYTLLTIWLMQLGIRVLHGRPYHPQTQGKEERFHRTLNAEVLNGRSFRDLAECQARFDQWRTVYNHRRPHESIAMMTPDTRYQPSQRAFPEVLPPIEYDCCDLVRKVDSDGYMSFKGHSIRVGKPFRRLPVALRSTPDDGLYEVRFCSHRIGALDLRHLKDPAWGVVDIAKSSHPQFLRDVHNSTGATQAGRHS
jgi:transposase InsO family protein